MEHGITFYGRFGEEILYRQTGEGSYLVSCKELRMADHFVSKQELEDFIKRYVEVGVAPQENDPALLKSRAIHMGRWVRRCYIFLKGPAEEALLNCARIYQTMLDAKTLGLSAEQYLKWFLLQGDERNPESLSLEEKEYLNALLRLKMEMVDKHAEDK